MKTKIVALILVLFAGSAIAQWQHRHDGTDRRHVIVRNSDWVAPLIIGGIVGAAIVSQNQPQPTPVIVQSQIDPQYVFINGIAYRRQLMVINGVLTEVLVK